MADVWSGGVDTVAIRDQHIQYPYTAFIFYVCVYPALSLFITRATGTLVNTPTNPDGGGGGFGEEIR